MVIYFKYYMSELLSMIDRSVYVNAEEAITVLSLHDLRYSTKRGELIDSNGVRESYCNKEDIPKNIKTEDVVKDYFLRYLKNESKRIDFFKERNQKYFY